MVDKVSEVFVTSHLMGGLGNQMFQIANAYSQSLTNNLICHFKTQSETNLQRNNVNRYTPNIFKKVNFNNNITPTIRYYEKKFSYDEVNCDYTKSVEFYGYFQSEKYFIDHKNKIINLFLCGEPEKSLLKKKYPQINNDNTLSLHIRRGDYLSYPKVHPPITIDYINKSVELINGYSFIFIFTDDKQWVKENIKLENTILVDDEDYNEMWLMSLCKNNIMSNSSFSWWGAFLNKNPDKKIIAPSIWFGLEGPQDFKDIYQENTIII